MTMIIENHVLARIPAVRNRLAKSLSGWICVRRFSVQDKQAANVLIAHGEVEKVPTPLGLAYRLRSFSKDEGTA